MFIDGSSPHCSAFDDSGIHALPEMRFRFRIEPAFGINPHQPGAAFGKQAGHVIDREKNLAFPTVPTQPAFDFFLSQPHAAELRPESLEIRRGSNDATSNI